MNIRAYIRVEAAAVLALWQQTTGLVVETSALAPGTGAPAEGGAGGAGHGGRLASPRHARTPRTLARLTLHVTGAALWTAVQVIRAAHGLRTSTHHISKVRSPK